MDEKRYLIKAEKYGFILYTRDDDPIHDKTFLYEFSDKEITVKQIVDVLAHINTGFVIDPSILENKVVFRRINAKRYMIKEYTYIEYELYEENGVDINESANIGPEIEIIIKDTILRIICSTGEY